MTKFPETAMISYIGKGWEQEEYTYNPDRERRPPVERRLKEVEVEGSLGAGMVKVFIRIVIIHVWSALGDLGDVWQDLCHIKKVVPRIYSPFS